MIGGGGGTVAAVGAAAAAGLTAFGIYYPNSRLFGAIIGNGPRSCRKIYLTFDDGPNEHATPAILSTLASERVPAAFFMASLQVTK